MRTPYHHVRDAGHEDILDDVRETLDGDNWAHLTMQCTPKTLAAGAVYYLHKTQDNYPSKTQVEIAEDFDTTSMSVRSGFKRLAIYHGFLDAEQVNLPHE